VLAVQISSERGHTMCICPKSIKWLLGASLMIG
jgi:hypothetical protein